MKIRVLTISLMFLCMGLLNPTGADAYLSFNPANWGKKKTSDYSKKQTVEKGKRRSGLSRVIRSAGEKIGTVCSSARMTKLHSMRKCLKNKWVKNLDLLSLFAQEADGGVMQKAVNIRTFKTDFFVTQYTLARLTRTTLKTIKDQRLKITKKYNELRTAMEEYEGMSWDDVVSAPDSELPSNIAGIRKSIRVELSFLFTFVQEMEDLWGQFNEMRSSMTEELRLEGSSVEWLQDAMAAPVIPLFEPDGEEDEGIDEVMDLVEEEDKDDARADYIPSAVPLPDATDPKFTTRDKSPQKRPMLSREAHNAFSDFARKNPAAMDEFCTNFFTLGSKNSNGEYVVNEDYARPGEKGEVTAENIRDYTKNKLHQMARTCSMPTTAGVIARRLYDACPAADALSIEACSGFSEDEEVADSEEPQTSGMLF